MLYGHPTTLWRGVNDRTKRDPGLSGDSIGLSVDWCASTSACSRVETAAEKMAGETKTSTEGQKGETICRIDTTAYL